MGKSKPLVLLEKCLPKCYNRGIKRQFNEEEVLHDKGRVSAEIAKSFAESEYEKYRVIQDRLFESDFDKLLASTEEKRDYE